jgi:hypothetical protein
MRRLGVIAALCLALAGCGWEGRGVIMEKTHTGSYTWSQMICSAYNGQGVCTVWVPMIHTEPESWGYQVMDNGGDKHSVTVEKADWDKARVGDDYDNRSKR